MHYASILPKYQSKTKNLGKNIIAVYPDTKQNDYTINLEMYVYKKVTKILEVYSYINSI